MSKSNYINEPIDNVRNELVGNTFKIIDIGEKGSSIRLKRDDGKEYFLDTSNRRSRSRGVTVDAFKSDSEKIAFLEKLAGMMIEKLGIAEEEIQNMIDVEEVE